MIYSLRQFAGYLNRGKWDLLVVQASKQAVQAGCASVQALAAVSCTGVLGSAAASVFTFGAATPGLAGTAVACGTFTSAVAALTATVAGACFEIGMAVTRGKTARRVEKRQDEIAQHYRLSHEVHF